MKIKVGEKEIGDGCPPFIICEIGSNWTSLDDCLESIRQAKGAGADAVKFQLFTQKELYGVDQVHGLTLSNDYRPPFLNPEWLPKLKHECNKMNIEFMCTAFSPEGYDVVNPYVNIHKVASAEMTHVRILEKLRSLGKPVIMSTGASGRQDVEMAIKHLTNDFEGETPVQTPIVLMYCVASYPANEIDLNKIQLMKAIYGLPCGYSDHSTDVLTIPPMSIHHEACVLEKHFTAIDADTPDKGHSLNPNQFKKMVDRIRCNGRYDINLGPHPSEQPMILKHNRRLIAIKDIAKGETLQEGVNFGIYRSLKDDTHAFSPFAIDHVNGKASLTDIKAGNGIGPGDV